MSNSIDQLTHFLSHNQIVTGQDKLNIYGTDWLKLYPPHAKCIVFPQSQKNVEDIICWALKHKQALVPSGGRTGLSGGATATKNEVVVSFDKMNEVLEFNEIESSLRVQPGVVTQTVQQIAKEKSLYFPLSIPSEGSSQIGGNTSTNAGGIHVIRYGTMRKWVLGLKVVTGKGDTLSLGRGLVKNTAGYDLMHLFIGSEGTLGFITEVTLKLIRPPVSSPCVLLLATAHLSALMKLYLFLKTKLSLRAFEVFTLSAAQQVRKMTALTFPLKDSAYYVLLECDSNDKNTAMTLFEEALQKNYISDGVMSESTQQAKELWTFREHISEALSAFSPYKNDISVKPSAVPDFLSDLTLTLEKQYPASRVVWFGHLGDGNLHINILKPKEESPEQFLEKCNKLSDILFSVVKKYNGSISAEHGVGLLKKHHLHYSCSQAELTYMKAIKKIFDPEAILNPGKIFHT